MYPKKGLFRCGLRAVLGALLITQLFLSCTSRQTAPNDDKNSFVAHIKSAEDVRKLRQTEAILTVTPEKAAFHPEYQIVEKIALPYAPEYRMGPGDIVEIVYHIRYDEVVDNYRLEVQDKISIQFPYHPQFSSTVLVRTDGKITVPLIGDVAAESLTPEELATSLNEKYAGTLNKPSITVALEEFNVKIRELKRAITTAPRGQSKIAPVTPDGKISFPIIGTIQAEGFTVSQLEEIVNRKYKGHVRNLNSTLILLEIKSPKFYVLGEVQSPGAYEMTSKLNLLDALTLARGYNDSANLKEIVIFRNEGLEKPIAFKVNLKSALKQGNLHANLKIKPADIIFVPKTGLDAFNDLMAKIFSRGLYTILPFVTDYNWNYRIDGNQ